MTINSEQIQALKAAADATPATEWKFHERHSLSHVGDGYVSIDGREAILCLSRPVGGMAHSCAVLRYIAAANPATIISLLAERDADKALIAELSEHISSLEEGVSMLLAQYDQLAAAIGWTTEKALAGEGNQEQYAEAMAKRIAELEASHTKLRESMAAIHNTIRLDGAGVSLSSLLSASKRAYEESTAAAGITLVVGGVKDAPK